MSPRRTPAILLASGALLAGGALAVPALVSGSSGATAGDVRGPCDEAEHAGDPRCAGPQSAEDRPGADDRPALRGRDDRRGEGAEDRGRRGRDDDDHHRGHRGRRGGDDGGGPGRGRRGRG
jgi:hypothetical protein